MNVIQYSQPEFELMAYVKLFANFVGNKFMNNKHT